MDADTPKLRLSGGHFSNEAADNAGLKELFRAEVFEELDLDRKKGTYLTTQQIQDLCKRYPDRKLLLFDLINQEMKTVHTDQTQIRFLIQRIEKAENPSQEKLQTLRERLIFLEGIEQSQLKAMATIQDLIGESEVMNYGEVKNVGETFHSLIKTIRE